MDSPKPAAWPWLVLGLLGTGALVVSVFVLLDPAIGSGSMMLLLALLVALVPVVALLGWLRSRALVVPAVPTATEITRLTREPDPMLNELASLRAMQRELIAAKQEAEAATMAKGEFLATMSHEIRTPLNGIVPLLDLLRSTPLRPDQRDYLSTAHQSAIELLRIVDDILDYSKLEASKLEIESVGVNLKEVVDSVAMLMESSATGKGLRLGVVIDPAVRLAVRGDPVRLRQILTNLVSNAIKFTERGSVTIQIGKRGESRSHHEITFAVRDTGIGLSDEAAAKLFQPFSQADASTTRVYGGTGLGLVICKRLVELMQGKIGVRSELGKGSTFWFNVPLQKAIGDIQARTDLVGIRALMLSGNDAFLQRAGGMLTQLGLSCLHSNLAVDALSKLRAGSKAGERGSYEVLLIDVATAAAATAALLRNIRRDPALDNLRILVAGRDEAVQDLRSDERLSALSENFDERELRETLNRVLGVGSRELQRDKPMLATSADERDENRRDDGSTRSFLGQVLLVEDNPVNARVASRLLSLHGINVDHALDGSIALRLLGEKRYDLVLMDCQMPVMDGYTATRTRRAAEVAEKLPRLPIVAMTANAMMGDREKCLSAGMDDYLTKPLDRRLLEATLAKWLREGVATPAAAAAPADAAESSAPKAAVAVQESTVMAQAVSQGLRDAVDQSVVQELLEVMGDGFGDLVQVYFEDTPKLLARLREAASRVDHAGIAEIAHSLKSSSANLGAMPLAELAKRAEIDARVRRDEELASLPDRLQDEYQRVVGAFVTLGLMAS